MLSRQGPPVSIRTVILALTVLSLVACQGDGPDPTVLVRYVGHGDWTDSSLFSAVVIEDGTTTRTLDGASLRNSTPTYPGLFTGGERFRLLADRHATVHLLLDTGSGTIDEPVTWKVDKNTDYKIDAVVDVQRMLGPCMRVTRAIALPPRGSATGDSLYINFGDSPRSVLC